MDLATAIALAALVISVIYHWAGRRDMQARMEEWKVHADRRMDSLELDIKQSKHAVLENRVSTIEKSIQEIRYWKHNTVDPYIPRAVDEHERRIGKLEE